MFFKADFLFSEDNLLHSIIWGQDQTQELTGPQLALKKRFFKELLKKTNGESFDFTFLKRVPSQSGFKEKVYQALESVPPGQTLSYKELASKAGYPKAHRAVGSAMAKNPWPLFVPCHRVTKSGSQKLKSVSAFVSKEKYSGPGGAKTKHWLLQLEGAL